MSDDIRQWNETKLQIEALRKIETELRTKIIQEHFKDVSEDPDSEGTFTAKLDDGSQLKLVMSNNVKLDQELFVIVKPSLENEGVPIDDIFKVKFELKEAIYKKLPMELKLRIMKHKFIEFTKASPQLKFIEAKAE